ncbi:hypothetical protein NIES4075_46210 [Tolypothrix sp. NIES-4075]|nr:hypothetical protein NIES4075_46210 [Tolypothrix sp. NIES-4075]
MGRWGDKGTPWRQGDKKTGGDEANNSFFPFPIPHYQFPIPHSPFPITNSPFPIPHYQLPITNPQLTPPHLVHPNLAGKL